MSKHPQNEERGGRSAPILLTLSLLLLAFAWWTKPKDREPPRSRPTSFHAAKPVQSVNATRQTASSSSAAARHSTSSAVGHRTFHPDPAKKPRVETPRQAYVHWGSRWWPAEVLRTAGDRHLIRYNGYGADWDEWVGPDRISFDPNVLVQAMEISPIRLSPRNPGDVLLGSRRFVLSTELLNLESTTNVHWTGAEAVINGRTADWGWSPQPNTIDPITGQIATKPESTALVEWGGRWWPAHVLKTENNRHFIRYQGYGSEWDEWVTEPRISFPRRDG
ncbi:MAG: Tudor-knot domain-containing protein [Verrucomicrobiota bacterium]